jgi:hypothetical protein
VRPEVQHGAAGVEDGGNEVGVAASCSAAGMVRVPAVGGGSQPEAGFELVEGEGDQHGGRGAAGVGQVAGSQQPPPGVG